MGSLIAEARTRLKLSQVELATAVGVSQATISRIEQSEKGLTDIKLAAKIAKKLDLELANLLAEEAQVEIDSWSDSSPFYAFCPNPFCELNTTYRAGDGDAFVSWKSGQGYPSERFAEVNFCRRCGTELVKECPKCGRRLTGPGTKFCIACGHKVTSRPTEDEWGRIRKLHPVPSPKQSVHEPIDEDDIPF